MHTFYRILFWIFGALAVLYVLSWLLSFKKFDVSYGISFNQNHARSLGIDWKQNYEAMLKDLQPKHVRIAAMWNEVEAIPYEYNFANVDWMMDKAEEYSVDVLLVVGQKAPRWPECQIPEWVHGYQNTEAADHLLKYVRETVERYKDHLALEFWQLENEPYIPFTFGKCDGYRRDLIPKELEIVKELDPDRKIVMTDSGELSFWWKPARIGDILGTTMYRVVRQPNGKIFSYDWLPAGFYRIKSRFVGKSYKEFFVAELQAEPWFEDAGAEGTPIEEQEKTMNPQRLEEHLDYAERVGASRVYMWGVEWWYWMKETQNDDRYWKIIQERFK